MEGREGLGRGRREKGGEKERDGGSILRVQPQKIAKGGQEKRGKRTAALCIVTTCVTKRHREGKENENRRRTEENEASSTPTHLHQQRRYPTSIQSRFHSYDRMNEELSERVDWRSPFVESERVRRRRSGRRAEVMGDQTK